MKKILFLLAFAGFLVPAGKTIGQSWQWVAGCKSGAEGTDLTVDLAGNIIAIGMNYGNMTVFGTDTIPASIPGSGSEPLIAKFDPSGNVLWADGVLNGAGLPLGVTTDGAGNVYFLGTFSGTVQIGGAPYVAPGTSSFFLIKYNPAGTIKWVRTVGSRILNNGFLGHSGNVCADMNGNLYIVASFSGASFSIGATTLTTAGMNDVFVAKYDTLGNPVWTTTFGGPNDELVSNMTVSSAGNVCFTGTFFSPSVTFGPTTLTNTGATANSSIFVVQLDPSGNVMWAVKDGGHSEHVQGITTDAQNNVYIAGRFDQSGMTFGSVTLSNPYTYPEIFVSKFDSAGNVGWAKGITTPAHILLDIDAFDIAADACGNVWMCGRMDSLVYIDSISIVNTTGHHDPYLIAGYDPTGKPLGGTVLQYGGDDVGGIATDASGNVFVCGDFAYGPFTVGSTTLVDGYPTMYEDLFIAKYQPGITRDTTILSNKDTTLCNAAGVKLTAPGGYSRYIWSNGSTGTTLVAPAAGTYWVQATSACSLYIDTFNIRAERGDTVYRVKDTSLCYLHKALVIGADAGYANYLWSTGDSVQRIAVTMSGTYYVTGYGECNMAVDTFHIHLFGNGSLYDITASQAVQYGGSIQLNVMGALYYEWVPDDGTLNNANINNPIATPQRKTTYTVFGIDQHGCRDTASVVIDVINHDIAIPSAFTPNGDGLNDRFTVLNAEGYKIDAIKIFNRWGQQVFSEEDGSNKGWDGTFGGVPQDVGVFYYLIEITTPNGLHTTYKGDLTMIR